MKKIIGQGAEAIVYLDDFVIKDRIEKSYRISEIDLELRKTRTRREAKVLETLFSINFPAPKLIDTDRKSIVRMGFIDGKKLVDILEENPVKFGIEIGKKLAILHNKGIIHGDLTTSNMIFNIAIPLVFDKLCDIDQLNCGVKTPHTLYTSSMFTRKGFEVLTDEIYFIDFGLSFFSEKVEDKAVDLHLLRQALESKHYKVWEVCFNAIFNSYSESVEMSKEILIRFEKVESRGRNKSKV